MIILLVFIFVWLGMIPILYFKEKKSYNNGICKCGGHLEYFDTDSQGSDGYSCDKCECVKWLSWYKPNNTNELRNEVTTDAE